MADERQSPESTRALKADTFATARTQKSATCLKPALKTPGATPTKHRYSVSFCDTMEGIMTTETAETLGHVARKRDKRQKRAKRYKRPPNFNALVTETVPTMD